MIQNRGGGPDLEDEERLPWLEPVDDFDDEQHPSPARLLVMLLGGLLLIGAVLGALWWFQNGGPRGDGELIMAEAGDYKTLPTIDRARVFEGEGDAAYAASEGMIGGGMVDPNRLPEEPAVTPEEREAALAAAAAAALKKAEAEKAATQQASAHSKQADAKAIEEKPKQAEHETKKTAPAPAILPQQLVSPGTVQLGAFSSEGAANKAWTNLSSRFAYLSEYARSIAPATVGKKTVYRLRINAGSKKRADDLCQKLRVAGEGCVIIR